MKTYGTLDNPFPELPPAASFYSVAWGGGQVNWPTRPFSYLECAVAAPPLTESYYGTASFWIRVNGALTVDTEAPYYEIIPILSMMGPPRSDNLIDLFEVRILNNTGGQDLRINVLNDRVIGTIRVVCEAVNGEESPSIPSGTPGSLFNNAWGHVLLTWDFLAQTGTITVNKGEMPNYPTSQSYDLGTSGDVSTPSAITAPVAWQDTARWFGAQSFVPEGDPEPPARAAPAEPLPANHMIALAQVWVSTRERITDVSKFVDADNKPAKLGPGGAVTIEVDPGDATKNTTVTPDFYFVGGPKAFVKNAGTAGEATLVGEPPIAQTVKPLIGS